MNESEVRNESNQNVLWQKHTPMPVLCQLSAKKFFVFKLKSKKPMTKKIFVSKLWIKKAEEYFRRLLTLSNSFCQPLQHKNVDLQGKSPNLVAAIN